MRDMIEPVTKKRPVCQPDSQPAPPIYIFEDVLEEIRFSAGWRADRIAGGVLVGRRYRCSEDGTDFVEVDGFVAGTHIDGIPAFMRYLRMQWKAARAALRYNFPDGEVVGWYIGSPSGKPVTNQDTLLLHHTYFSHPWQLGLWISGNDAPASLVADGEALVTRNVGITISDERADG